MRSAFLKSLAKRPLWQLDTGGAALIAVAAGLWYFAGVEPLQEAQAVNLAKQEKLAQLWDQVREKAEKAANEENGLARVKEDIERSSIQLQGADNVNLHVSRITEAAGVARLRVDEIKPSQPEFLPRFTMVPIKLSGAGDYEAVLGFFATLRSQFRDTGVTGFTLERNKADDGHELGFVINLAWYAAPAMNAPKK